MNIGDGFGHPDLSTVHSFEDSYGLFGTENDDELWPDKNKWCHRFIGYTPDLIVRDDFLDELQENDLPREDSLMHSAMEYHNRNDLG